MIAAALWLEAPFYGIAMVWALSLVPAAIVTLFKDRLPLFLAGWLTLGIAWFVGAVTLAPPNSLWARWFYDDERLARAAEPRLNPPPARTVAWGTAAVLAAILLLGLFAARPVPLLKVGGGALQTSVGGSDLFSANDPCIRLDNGDWRCGIYDGQASGNVLYRVDLHGRGCWTAIRESPIRSSPKRLTGCVTLIDHLLRS